MKADFHCHSTYSDGSCTVREIISFAKQQGLHALALTDHDTTAGCLKIKALAGNIEIVPAMEITTRDHASNTGIHILCYYPHSKALEIGRKTVQNRQQAKVNCIQKLSEKYPITVDYVTGLQGESVCIHQPHILKALCQMGYCAMGDKAFKDSIFNNAMYLENYALPNTWDVCKCIAEEGGIAVMAHPGENNAIPVAWKLAQAGLLHGLECYHPRNSEQVKQDALQICAQYKLLATGGTDFHGAYSSNPNPLGTYLCPEASANSILAYQK